MAGATNTARWPKAKKPPASARTAIVSPLAIFNRYVSGSLPDGQRFQDVRELKRLLLKDERQIARNLTTQPIVFATGVPVQFSDRPKVEAILDRAATNGFGVKRLIQLIIESELFRNK